MAPHLQAAGHRSIHPAHMPLQSLGLLLLTELQLRAAVCRLTLLAYTDPLAPLATAPLNLDLLLMVLHHAILPAHTLPPV